MSGYPIQSPHAPSAQESAAAAIQARYAAQLQRMEQRRMEQDQQIKHQQAQIDAQQQYLDQQRQEAQYASRLATPLASPSASPMGMPRAMFTGTSTRAPPTQRPPSPTTQQWSQQPRDGTADAYVPVFDSRRNLFGGSPRRSPTSHEAAVSPMRSPPRQLQQAMSPARGASPVAATYRPMSPQTPTQQQQQYQQRPPSPSRDSVQQTVNDVASSRFSPFIPRSPHPIGGQPVSVLVVDDHDVVAAMEPQQQPMSPYAASVLASPNFQQQQQQQSAEIMAILPSTRPPSANRTRDVNAGGHVYTFGIEDDDVTQLNLPVRLHPSPDAAPPGLSSSGPSPVSSYAGSYTSATGVPLTTPTYRGDAQPTPLPTALDSSLAATTTHIQVQPAPTTFHPSYHVNDLEAITLKIGGCWDLAPKTLLIGNSIVLFLMLLFTCIAFGVSWSTGDKTDTTTEIGGHMEFFIGHFTDYAGDPAMANVSVSSYTRDYSSVSDWRNQCTIDNYRVPICLGFALPFLFLVAWAVYERSKDHYIIKWRRLAILFLVLYGAFMLLAAIFWWQGCGNFVQAAVRDNGVKVLTGIHFSGSTHRRGQTRWGGWDPETCLLMCPCCSFCRLSSVCSGWWLTMLNVFLTFLAIFTQGTAYGEDRCCVCTC